MTVYITFGLHASVNWPEYFRLYQIGGGGIEKLREVNFCRPESALNTHITSLEAYFREHPSVTIKEAQSKIIELTAFLEQEMEPRLEEAQAGRRRCFSWMPHISCWRPFWAFCGLHRFRIRYLSPHRGHLIRVEYPQVKDDTGALVTPMMRYTYNVLGLLETETDERGVVTEFVYALGITPSPAPQCPGRRRRGADSWQRPHALAQP